MEKKSTKIAYGVAPVSYTHLDVYKRQDEACCQASRMEILRRYYAGCVERLKGQADECVVRKLELVMQQAGVTPDICPAVAASLAKAEATGKPAGAMVLPDGSVVTGKTSALLGASAALLLNALKKLAGIDHKLELIPASVIEPISTLKTESLDVYKRQVHIHAHGVDAVLHHAGQRLVQPLLGHIAVSYTHLDVYKRQTSSCIPSTPSTWRWRSAWASATTPFFSPRSSPWPRSCRRRRPSPT